MMQKYSSSIEPWNSKGSGSRGLPAGLPLGEKKNPSFPPSVRPSSTTTGAKRHLSAGGLSGPYTSGMKKNREEQRIGRRGKLRKKREVEVSSSREP